MDSEAHEEPKEKIIPADAIQRIDLTGSEEKIIPADADDLSRSKAAPVEKQAPSFDEAVAPENKSDEAPVVDRAEEKRKKKEAKAAEKAKRLFLVIPWLSSDVKLAPPANN